MSMACLPQTDILKPCQIWWNRAVLLESDLGGCVGLYRRIQNHKHISLSSLLGRERVKVQHAWVHPVLMPVMCPRMAGKYVVHVHCRTAVSGPMVCSYGRLMYGLSRCRPWMCILILQMPMGACSCHQSHFLVLEESGWSMNRKRVGLDGVTAMLAMPFGHTIFDKHAYLSILLKKVNCFECNLHVLSVWSVSYFSDVHYVTSTTRGDVWQVSAVHDLDLSRAKTGEVGKKKEWCMQCM